MADREKIILGIDPGTSVMGYGLIKIIGKKLDLVQFGVIHLSKYKNHEVRLKKIFDLIIKLITEYLPDEMALEAPFYGKNIQSMLKLGRAQGVAMAAALSRDVPIVEYAPKRVKQAVTGNGNASKEQVAYMIKNLLNFDEAPKLLDATDALAVALCHYYNSGSNTLGNDNSSNSWNSFVEKHAHRVKS